MRCDSGLSQVLDILCGRLPPDVQAMGAYAANDQQAEAQQAIATGRSDYKRRRCLLH